MGYSEKKQKNEISATPEKELILRCQKGENAAMEEMLNRYKNMVRSKATALYLVGADKEDLIQEGMIGLFKAICEYKPEKNESFSAFAGLCISRQMYTAIKYSNTKKNQPLNNYVSIDLVDGSEDAEQPGSSAKKYEGVDYWQKNPENFVIDRERSIQLEEEVVSCLSHMERQVLAYYTAGFPYQRIAELMEKEPKSIDNALQRIRKKLKTVLAISSRM
ncbi:MAG: sigma-70 family RNA polymerase sigma factor [Lachnospiraceae bacterium]|nr:sigma-70 family RNA polymerase sigma factor [Lachnospiraceae bacterium]